MVVKVKTHQATNACMSKLWNLLQVGRYCSKNSIIHPLSGILIHILPV